MKFAFPMQFGRHNIDGCDMKTADLVLWQGGDAIVNEYIPEVAKAMRACVQQAGAPRLFSSNILADTPNETIARG
eukprot:5122410-Alexandrium_andersonii.AAC.1